MTPGGAMKSWSFYYVTPEGDIACHDAVIDGGSIQAAAYARERVAPFAKEESTIHYARYGGFGTQGSINLRTGDTFVSLNELRDL